MTANITNKNSLSLPPDTSTLLTLPLSTRLTPGSLVTAVLQYAEGGSAESVAGVRVAKAYFPIEAWPKSHECPFPTVNDTNYKVSVYTCQLLRFIYLSGSQYNIPRKCALYITNTHIYNICIGFLAT